MRRIYGRSNDGIVSDIARFGDAVVSIMPCSHGSSVDDEARLTDGATLAIAAGDPDRDGGDKPRKKIRHKSTL